MKPVMMITILVIVTILSITLPNKLNADNLYKYTDEAGNVFIVDDIEKLPENYKKITKDKTPIIIARNNAMYVPVKITYKGYSVKVNLIIDTGCTELSISPTLANRLGINQGEGTAGAAILADGSMVTTNIVITDKVQVGPKILKNVRLQITPNKSNEETGLLGMGFLKHFPHSINTKARVIIWT